MKIEEGRKNKKNKKKIISSKPKVSKQHVSSKVERVAEMIPPHASPKNDRVVDALQLTMHTTTMFLSNFLFIKISNCPSINLIITKKFMMKT